MGKISKYLPHITVSNTDVPLADTTLINAGEWYTLTDTRLICLHANKFTNNEGVVTFIGDDNFGVLFNGTADVEVDRACRLSFQLFKIPLGETIPVIVPGILSVKDFSAPAKIGTLAKSHGLDIVKGDQLLVRAMTSAAGTVLSITTISLVFKG